MSKVDKRINKGALPAMEAATEMERKAVRSRDIAIVGYDPKSSTLEIAFRIGGVYHYSGVPAAIHKGLLASSSQGRYFDQKIKHRYPYTKIR